MNNGMTEQGLYDIYAQWHVPFWQTGLFYSICAILFFVLASPIVYFVIRHYRSKKVVLSPWDQALHDLDCLHRDTMGKVSEGKRFYGILTSVLKKYVHERYFDKSIKHDFLMDGVAHTDQEFVLWLQKYTIEPELIEQLREIFMGSMVVKFAREQAIQEQMEKDLFLAKSFIRRTQPSHSAYAQGGYRGNNKASAGAAQPINKK